MASSTKNINVDVLNRILGVLQDKRTIKITKLAMYSGINYNTCKRYLQLMRVFGLIENSSDDKSTMIKVTEEGIKIHNALNDQ